ncbi:MAG: lipid II:glycine glycyltransferase FemX [Alphaproteobacteria bacterium]
MAEAADEPAWNDFLQRWPEVPALASMKFVKVLTESYPVETPLFLAENGGRVVGVLSAYINRRLKNRGELYTPPYGLLADSDADATALLQSVRSYSALQGIARVRVNAAYRAHQVPFLAWQKTGIRKEIGIGADAVWSGFRAKTRNLIRKAEKSGVTVHVGFETIQPFYRIYVDRMCQLGLSIHSPCYLELLAAYLGQDAQLFVAMRGGEVIAGMVFVFGPQVAFYHLNASTLEARSYGANDLLMWEVIKWSLERGVSVLDLSEATPGGNVYKFKTREIGGEPGEVHYFDAMRDDQNSANDGIQPTWPLDYRLLARAAPLLPGMLRRRALKHLKPFQRVV